MFLRMPSRNRPYHLGSYPLETLPVDLTVGAREQLSPRVDSPGFTKAPQGPLAEALRDYLDIFVRNAMSEPAPARAPVPDDPYRRMIDVKGYSYFMNTSQVGICRMEPNAWCKDADPMPHDFAVVLLLEHGQADRRRERIGRVPA